jgi:phosphoserine aminotransferase
MTTTTNRIFNFSAGPAVLPLPVLEEAQRDLVALPGVGMSVIEISHRSKTFEGVLDQAIEDIRSLAGVPSGYRLLLLQGGASLQFSMVPMNLLGAGQTADYVDTGSWSDKAAAEARKIGRTHVTGSTRDEGYRRIPAASELSFTPGAAYVHITTNNTIEGTQWPSLPDTAGAPLVADASSDIFSGPVDVGRFGLIYAGAQKNLGPSGVTLVVIRQDLLSRSRDTLPAMLNYRTMAENHSLYNTPNTFGIYLLGLTMRWLKGLGGLEAIGAINARKARRLYAEVDRTGFYRGTAHPNSRSPMNVTFRLPTEALEPRRAQGPSFGRWDAGVDLQRLSRGGGGRPRRVHARVRTAPGLTVRSRCS